MALSIGTSPTLPVHGEFASADASALTESNSRAALYPQASATALTLAATDTAVVHSLVVSSAGANLTVTVYDGADATVDVGEVIWRGVVPTNTTQHAVLSVPHRCQAGTYPKVKASGAGQVYVNLSGYVLRTS